MAACVEESGEALGEEDEEEVLATADDNSPEGQANPIDMTGRTFRNLFVSRLPLRVQHSDLVALFAPYNARTATIMTDAKTGKSKGFGFVLFDTEEEGMVAHKALNKARIHIHGVSIVLRTLPSRHAVGKGVEVGPVLYVRNVPISVTKEEVERMLEQFGSVAFCAMREEPDGLPVWVILVEYDCQQCADNALSHLRHNTTLFPRVKLPVIAKYAKAMDRRRHTTRPYVNPCPFGNHAAAALQQQRPLSGQLPGATPPPYPLSNRACPPPLQQQQQQWLGAVAVMPPSVPSVSMPPQFGHTHFSSVQQPSPSVPTAAPLPLQQHAAVMLPDHLRAHSAPMRPHGEEGGGGGGSSAHFAAFPHHAHAHSAPHASSPSAFAPNYGAFFPSNAMMSGLLNHPQPPIATHTPSLSSSAAQPAYQTRWPPAVHHRSAPPYQQMEAVGGVSASNHNGVRPAGGGGMPIMESDNSGVGVAPSRNQPPPTAMHAMHSLTHPMMGEALNNSYNHGNPHTPTFYPPPAPISPHSTNAPPPQHYLQPNPHHAQYYSQQQQQQQQRGQSFGDKSMPHDFAAFYPPQQLPSTASSSSVMPQHFVSHSQGKNTPLSSFLPSGEGYHSTHQQNQFASHAANPPFAPATAAPPVVSHHATHQNNDFSSHNNNGGAETIYFSSTSPGTQQNQFYTAADTPSSFFSPPPQPHSQRQPFF